jgi:hypothetical protein
VSAAKLVAEPYDLTAAFDRAEEDANIRVEPCADCPSQRTFKLLGTTALCFRCYSRTTHGFRARNLDKLEEESHTKTLWHDTLTSEQVKAIPPPEWLVDGLLVRRTVAWLVGKWGLGKSFYAVDLALSMATGRSFHGCAVRPGNVLYVVAEGVAGIGARIAAWEAHNGVSDPGNIWWLRRPVNLHDPAAAGGLAELAAGLNVDLVVIDTLNRCMVGADENSAKDAGIVVEQLANIVAAAKTTVLVLHHPGKDASRGGRGSSAFIGAMDTELEMTGEDHDVKVQVTKQKDGPDGQEWYFRRSTIADSCVLVDATERADDLSTAALGALDALRDIYVPGGVRVTAWLSASGAPQQSFYRYRKLLLEREFVRNIGTDKSPRYQPVQSDGTFSDG